jgi:hypothetical protein
MKGIESSRSEFVWIAESDDWCEPTFLENMMSGLLANECCVVGYCQSALILESNKIKWISSFPFMACQMEGKEFIQDFMLLNNAIFNASMAVWRRSAFEKISREFVNFKYCGDWLFWIEMSMHGNVFISGKVLNYFRKHSADVSGPAVRSGDNFVEELNMFHLLYKRKWISNTDLTRVLKQKYIYYKAVAHTFTASRKKEIEHLFSRDLPSKNSLKVFYMGFYSVYALKKLLRFFASK